MGNILPIALLIVLILWLLWRTYQLGRKRDLTWSIIISRMAYTYLIGGIIYCVMGYFAEKAPELADYGAEYYHDYRVALQAYEQGRVDCIKGLALIILSFPFIMGFAKLVAAAEKYLNKQ